MTTHFEKYALKKGHQKSRTELRRKLRKVADLISDPLDKITVEKIKKANKDNNLSRDYFLAVASFLDYLYAEYGTDNKNVFRDYLKRSKEKRASKNFSPMQLLPMY